jgi:hypothetical protein
MKLDMNQALTVLGLTQQELHAAISAEGEGGPDIWERRTEAFRRCIKEARKRRLREVHPDVCGDEDATERAQEINGVADALVKVSVVPPPQPRPMPVVIVQHWQSGFGGFTQWHNAGSATTYTSGGGWSPTGGF